MSAQPGPAARPADRWRLRALDTVDSTNERVKDALRSGEPEGLVVSALQQSGGYGRQGRAWSSPLGGLYLSLLLRPDVPLRRLPTLSLVTGLAVREAVVDSVAPELADRVQVKWPNDVVLADEGARIRKLCGISLEHVGGGVCIGIGVNVFESDDEPALAGKNRRCFLEDMGFSGSSVEPVRDAVLERLAASYDRWRAEGFAPFLDEYSAHALLTGKAVRIEDIEGNVIVEGRANGVDEDGRLLVFDAEAREAVAVSSGEAHISSIASLF